MTDQAASTRHRPLRLWPGVLLVTLMWLSRYGVPVVAPEASLYAMLGGLGLVLAVVVWWAFFSRAPHAERWGALGLMVLAAAATARLVHESVATGMMGVMPYIYLVPLLSLGLVVGAAAGRGRTAGARRAALAAGILLACGTLLLVRTEGMDGVGDSDFHWRWSPTTEERLLAQTAGESAMPAAAPAPTRAVASPEAAPATAAETAPTEAALATAADTATTAPRGAPSPTAADEASRVAVAAPAAAEPTDEQPADVTQRPSPAGATRVTWPGFRGADRDGVVRGVRIATDWSASPPLELWRRPVGPGWSSFAVDGDRFYTQEQRGEEELVVCYLVATGEPVWRHADAARFWESNAGAGPRATPTLADGRVYTLGATGIVNALDARDGTRLWSRNAGDDTERKVPGWGFAGSPLVVDDLVVVAAAGNLVAYDIATGEPRWFGPKGGGGYSSPHLVTLDGVPQILLMGGTGTTSVAPTDGAVLWQHPWPTGAPIVQPSRTADGDVLLGGGGSDGMRRLAIARGAGGWTADERWTSNGLKPYFNDSVVHEGHVYGIDGTMLAAIDVTDGKRRWKGGRYGSGQLVLLADQDLLLVLSEKGDLALVAAAPEEFRELGKVPAIEGKTWNHPVVAGDVVLVRNGEEMVAFRLPVEQAAAEVGESSRRRVALRDAR